MLLAVWMVFSIPNIEGTKEIIVNKGGYFFLKLNASYISKGKIEISSSLSCIHLGRKEYTFGDVYSSTKIPFYVYGHVDCEPGLYIINITAEAEGYKNTWYVPIFVIKNVRISDYFPKVLEEGEINEVYFVLSDYEHCDEVCLIVEENLYCLEKGKNSIVVEIPGKTNKLPVEIVCNFRGMEFKKQYNLSFLTLKEIPEIEILDGEISDNRIEMEVSKPGIYCFDVYPPLYLKEKCVKLSGRRSFDIYLTEKPNSTRFLMKVKYYGKENDMEYYIPLYLSNLPEINLYYSGIDYKSRKIIVIVSNEGKGPATSIKISYGRKTYFIDKLGDNEWRKIYLPYMEKLDIKLKYKDINGNEFSKNITISPDFVVFRDNKKGDYWEIFISIFVIVAVLLIIWRLRG